MQDAPVVVIGAGVVGVACALNLRRDGRDVLVLDPGGPGEGCSYGNAGSISPDMVVPMSMPGMLAKVPGWLTDPLGPLAIAPRHAPRALPWLLRWIEAGRMSRVRQSSTALRALHRPVFELYRELLGDRYEGLLHGGGQLYVWRRTGATRSEMIADALRAACGVRVEEIGVERLRDMEPALSPEYRRALFFPDNGRTSDPRGIVRTMAEAFQREGGAMRRCAATGFDTGADGAVRAVRTAEGPVTCAAVVIAAGAHSGRVARHLGLRLPLEAERGYHVMLPDPGIRLHHQISNREVGFSVNVMADGLRFAGTVEIAGLDAPPVAARAEALVRNARNMFPGIRTEGHRTWFGFRPSTPDSVPVIGPAPGIRNAFLAFGHGHTGMTGAPMTGRLIADLVAGRAPAIDPAPYSATRFGLAALLRGAPAQQAAA
ncbi:NAD(P)/FAD-dependent oxidoreductase [Falsiroseomonas sp.]|uniref:NAD(P)/FAD-dependent oxidoreductase n=1 Tax=Falsiroseomonas sp. TaxID=2870721 RepID=UPI0035682AB9